MPEDLCVASVFIAQSERNVVSFHFSAHMDCQTEKRNSVTGITLVKLPYAQESRQQDPVTL